VTDDLLIRWLRLAAVRVAEARERLTDLDAVIGDGDHGSTSKGFRELAGGSTRARSRMTRPPRSWRPPVAS